MTLYGTIGDIYRDKTDKISITGRIEQMPFYSSFCDAIETDDTQRCICNKQHVQKFRIIYDHKEIPRRYFLIGRDCADHFEIKPRCVLCGEPSKGKALHCSSCLAFFDSEQKARMLLLRSMLSEFACIETEAKNAFCTKCSVSLKKTNYLTCFSCSGMKKCDICKHYFNSSKYSTCFCQSTKTKKKWSA